MRSLPLFVLLLFGVVIRAAASSPSAPGTLMEELVANGTRQRLRTCKGLYLTEERPKLSGGAFFSLEYRLSFWALPWQDLLQHWTIEQINDREVAIKSNLGYYIGHGSSTYSRDAQVADQWETLTATKNTDGSWSFKSRAAGWLSAQGYHSNNRRFITFNPGNSVCEHWWPESFTPPAKSPLMAELLANGGRRRFKAYNGLYLTFKEQPFWKRNELNINLGGSVEQQYWIIEQINENEVTIRDTSTYRHYVSHSDYDEGRPAPEANTWEMLTPVKNANGSWSFKSRWDKWMSGGGYRAGQVHFMPNNLKCEKWILEPW